MKKLIVRILLLAAVLCLLVTAVFADGGFNAGLEIENNGSKITVTVQDSEVFASKTAKLTIPTGMDWPWAKVTIDGAEVSGVQWDADTRSVTFPVAKGGAYVIEAAEKPAEDPPVTPVVPSGKPADQQEEPLKESPVFTDVHDAGHWAADSIDFVTARGLFNGVTEDTFEPDSTMTRAMLMTVLARLDGQSTEGGANWYDKGMAWAKANGVSDGSNPGGSITREQLVTMLWRYAGEPEATGSLSAFPDAHTVSDYAAEAMAWAVETGIINGLDGKLAPQDTATRAQVAAVLARYCE